MLTIFIVGLAIGLFFGFGIGRRVGLKELGRIEYRNRVANIKSLYKSRK